jgi:predicted Zn-dependent protease
MAKSRPSRTSRARPPDRQPAEPTPTVSADAIWSPPARVPLAGVPGPGSVAAFEQAVSLLQRHEYRGAVAAFEALERQFPTEGALLDRARVYAALCRREMRRASPAAPRTVEERVTVATVALNNGEDRRAEELIRQVLEDAPRHELGHYLLAVVHARRGATAAALDALRHALAVSPEVRAQARHDADFESLRGNDAFDRMMGDAPAQSGARRRS